ncbi:MAG: chemotaxis response regulator protein-glutamate methylesterase [Gammaproteobacteria bacterium]
MNKKITVLIVDDSALVRKMLTRMLESDPHISVIGTAIDPLMARDKIKQLNPDVLTLDVEMPRMDGVSFLKNLMRLRPMPVVMVSSLTVKGADVTLQALEYGAVDFVSKPAADLAASFDGYAEELITKVKIAACAKVSRLVVDDADAGIKKQSIIPSGNFKTTDMVIVIGSSTGGTEAVREILEVLPANSPGIVITQHIPEAFSKPFADRLNKSCAMTVSEAKDGDLIMSGHAYIAPGSHHLMIVRDGAQYRCRLTQSDPVNRHRPSVDVLFQSAVKNVGRNAIGLILTGMGADGAQGMLNMREAGAYTIAQDEQSSVVWGMPGAAVKLDAAIDILPLNEVASRVIAVAEGKHKIKPRGNKPLSTA